MNREVHASQGHASLLTAFILIPDATHIITANRDEHICVGSLKLLKTFCFGQKIRYPSTNSPRKLVISGAFLRTVDRPAFAGILHGPFTWTRWTTEHASADDPPQPVLPSTSPDGSRDREIIVMALYITFHVSSTLSSPAHAIDKTPARSTWW